MHFPAALAPRPAPDSPQTRFCLPDTNLPHPSRTIHPRFPASFQAFLRHLMSIAPINDASHNVNHAFPIVARVFAAPPSRNYQPQEFSRFGPLKIRPISTFFCQPIRLRAARFSFCLSAVSASPAFPKHSAAPRLARACSNFAINAACCIRIVITTT